MKIEVNEMFQDIKLFAAYVDGVCYNNGTGVTTRAPNMADWPLQHGKVTFVVGSEKRAELVKKALEKYSLQAQIVNARPPLVEFECGLADDIMLIINMFQEKKYLRQQNDSLKNQLSAVHSSVEQMADQIKYVKSSLFSKGVNALKHNVEVLNNVVAVQKNSRNR